MKIDIANAFVGTGASLDLVLVGDTVQDTPRQLQQTIEGVGRALDIVASRRPLTLVLVGPRPGTDVIRAMSRYARVLPIGEVADELNLRNWLAALLPLELPPVGDARGDVANAELATEASDPLAQSLILAARQGQTAVEEAFHAAVEEPFDEAPDDVEGEPEE